MEEKIIEKNSTVIYKSVAIILILISHIGRYIGINLLKPLGSVGVAIFLVVSGYGLNESFNLKGRKGFISKRFVKVFIPYILIVIIYSIIQRANIVDIIKYSLLIELPNGMYWFIKYIICIYAIFYGATFIKNNKHRKYILAICILLFTIINYNIRNYIWQIFSFMSGVILSENQNKFKKVINNNKYIIIFTFITIVSVFFKKLPFVEKRETGILDTILQILITFNLSAIILIIINRFNQIRVFNNYLIREIGNVSYEIYLIHVFFFDVMKEKTIISIFKYLIIVLILVFILHIVNTMINKALAKGEKI